MTDLLSSSRANGLLTIRLNRPSKKNALTTGMYAGLTELFQQATTDDDVRVVMICGGENFCAGNDLQDFLEQPMDFLDSPAGRFLLTIAQFDKPLLAAVDGYAVGIGTTLLLHCDLVYCSDRALFSLPFVNLGLVPEFAASLLLPRCAGYRLAAELLLLGEPFDAATALRAGLVNAICEPQRLMDHSRGIAEKLAAKPAQALRETRALLRAEDERIDERIVREAGRFTTLLGSDDAQNAIAATLNKGSNK